MTAKKKAPAKKGAAKAKTKASKNGKAKVGSCAKVRAIADRNPNAKPQAVYAKCEAAGIHPRTTRAEYANWCRAKFGKSPSERFGTARR